MIQTGISFDGIHSFYDLGLILSSCDIPDATPKTNYIDVPGGDGSIDLTEVHGDIKYNDRECKFVFTAATSMNDGKWEEFKTKVNNALNGKKFENITLDKAPYHYFTGRCSINGHSVNKRLRQITVAATVAPWKYHQDMTVIEAELEADEKTLLLPNSRKKVCPIIECTNAAVVKFGGYSVALEAGAHKVLELQLAEGNNAVTFSGKDGGTIKFTYREGDL